MTDRHQRDTGGPRLTSRTGDWTYTDPAEHTTALQLELEHGISLARIDDWIDAGPWSNWAQRTRVLEWRAVLLECHRAGNSAAAEGWGLFLLTLAQFNLRVKELRPLALIGKQVQHRLPPPGEKKTIYTPKLSAVAARSREQRVIDATARGESAADIGRRERISARTVNRIRARNRP